MSHTKLAVVAVSCLVIAAPAVFVEGSAYGQEARDHAKDVQQLKDRTQDHDRERREQSEKDRKKLKELKEEREQVEEQEEGFGNDLDEDGVDSTE